MLDVVCYLDFDGVLHDDAVYKRPARGLVLETPGRVLFEWTPILIQALQPYPNLRIVLSTSWVRELGYDRARRCLPPEISSRVIGATFHRREHGRTQELRWQWVQLGRGNQIEADVRRRGVQKWLAIDDAVSEFSPQQAARLVPCESHSGLAAAEAQQALKVMLEREHREAGMADETHEVDTVVLALIPEFQQVQVRDREGHVYALTRKTRGVDLLALQEGQRIVCVVTRKLPRVLSAQAVPQPALRTDDEDGGGGVCGSS